MSNHYIFINATVSGSSDGKIKVTNGDTDRRFLDEKIVLGSNKLTKTVLNVGGDEDLELDVDETNIDHDLLLNFVANEHINHTAVALTAGAGLSGGGDIAASRQFDVDIANETDKPSPIATDELIISDSADSNNIKKVDIGNIAGALDHTELQNIGTNSHAQIDTHIANADIHREINDAGLAATDLWSADKIDSELDTKLDDFSSTNDNRLIKTDGTAGDAVQESGITVDDSNNVTGVNDLTVKGDLTVNGTTTSVNSTDLSVTDANITVNNGGDQAAADSQGAGITVEMSDATDGSLAYDSTLNSKFKIGELGTEQEIVGVNYTQTLQNKTLTSPVLNGTLTGSAVLDEDGFTSDSNTAVATQQSIKAYVDNEISLVTDENVKVSANDTTEKFLEDALVSANNRILLTTLNDGGDEDVQIQLIESNIDHDALANFVADEHVAHSSVEIATGVDSGLTGGGNISATRNLNVDINGTTAETNIVDNDQILLYDSSAGVLRKATRANFVGAPGASAGDINETSFNVANNQVAPDDITDFVFSNAEVRSFRAHVSVFIDATSNLYEELEIYGIQKAAGWEISSVSTGDDSLVNFSITSAGQLQYTTPSYAGFSSGVIKFRAITTSV